MEMMAKLRIIEKVCLYVNFPVSYGTCFRICDAICKLGWGEWVNVASGVKVSGRACKPSRGTGRVRGWIQEISRGGGGNQ